MRNNKEEKNRVDIETTGTDVMCSRKLMMMTLHLDTVTGDVVWTWTDGDISTAK